MDWIKVEDRLPNNNDEVLIYSKELEKRCGKKLKPYACFYHNGFKVFEGKFAQKWLDNLDISHWMLLPSPPK